MRKERRAIGRPTLGIHIALPAPTLRADLQVGKKKGIVIIQVLRGSAAEDAGLQEYDFIYEANGRKIKDNKSLIQVIQQTGIGGKVSLKIIRQGKKKTIQAKVGESSVP